MQSDHRSRPPSRPRRGIAALALGAAALAGAALYNNLRARQAERDNPPIGRFIEVDGVRLHYVERGTGRPVVLLHGNGAMVQDWAISGVLDAVAEDAHVIAFDRPGFGYSERPRDRVWTPAAQAELIAEALRRLGVEKPVVVGHSWGTLVTLALALDHREAVGAVVLLSGYYFPTPRLDVPLLSGPAVPVVGDVMRHTLSPLVGRLMTPAVVRRIFAPAPVAERFAAFPVELALRPSQLRALAADTALMVPAAAALAQRYGELHLPVVILAGDGDRIVGHAQAVRLHREIDGSDLRTVPDAGHMVHYLATGTVVTAIRDAATRAAPGIAGARLRPVAGGAAHAPGV